MTNTITKATEGITSTERWKTRLIMAIASSWFAIEATGSWPGYLEDSHTWMPWPVTAYRWFSVFMVGLLAWANWKGK